MVTFDQLKALVLFCKEHGVTRLHYDEMEFEIAEPRPQVVFPAPEEQARKKYQLASSDPLDDPDTFTRGMPQWREREDEDR